MKDLLKAQISQEPDNPEVDEYYRPTLSNGPTDGSKNSECQHEQDSQRRHFCGEVVKRLGPKFRHSAFSLFVCVLPLSLFASVGFEFVGVMFSVLWVVYGAGVTIAIGFDLPAFRGMRVLLLILFIVVAMIGWPLPGDEIATIHYRYLAALSFLSTLIVLLSGLADSRLVDTALDTLWQRVRAQR